jgi:ferric-dicitrate binding protein FerR (iron transport regulator)
VSSLPRDVSHFIARVEPVSLSLAECSEDYTGWTTGHLVFRETPIRDAVVEIGRAYDVDIRIADSALATRTLSWTVPVTQRSLTGVLEFLTDVLDAHLVRSGRVITIVPGRSSVRKRVDPRHLLTSESQYGK